MHCYFYYTRVFSIRIKGWTVEVVKQKVKGFSTAIVRAKVVKGLFGAIQRGFGRNYVCLGMFVNVCLSVDNGQ